MSTITEPEGVFAKLTLGYLFVGKSGKRYKNIKKIGEGGMGAVYLVEETETKQQYAVKCEKFKENHRILQRHGLRLAMEKLILKTCHRSEHYPNYQDAGCTETFGWIAMELVGPSLNALRHKVPSRKFCVVTCLKIGLQVFLGLKYLHDKGFVHRDLKPDNLAIGIGEKKSKIFILDLGIARQFLSVTGVPHRPRPHVRFKGTRNFAPLALQTNIEYGPKDDLESLLYILAMLCVGKLPWSNMPNDQMIESKKACRNRPEVIFDRTALSPVLTPLWKYTAKLRYEDPLDYDYIISYLTTALDGLGGENQPFDWEKDE